MPRFQFVERVARRKLRPLEIAGRLDDLRVPPGNRLEALRGDRTGQHSIRINDQFRLCFIWTAAGPDAVESEIVTGQRAITADTDLRLCRFLGLSPGYWLRAQAAHDTELAQVLNWPTSWSRSSPWRLLRRIARGIPRGGQSASPARRQRSDRRSAAGHCHSPDSPAPGPAATPHRR